MQLLALYVMETNVSSETKRDEKCVEMKRYWTG